MKWLDRISVALGVTAVLWAGASQADTANVTAFVEKTMVTADGTRGGCMASLSSDPAAKLPACRKTWVTFSCDGTHTDPLLAYRMLDQAQLALATGLQVQVTVTDEKQHEGYCFVERIKVVTE